MYTFMFLFATIAKHGKLSYQKHRGRTMKSIIKFGATLAGLTLSGVTLAGVPSGTITFTASDVAPALSVPTLGVVTAVMLTGLLLVLALHTLHKNRHTFASFALVGSSIGAALMVALMGVLQAVISFNVSSDDLDMPLSFICGDFGNPFETPFTNTTGQPIEVSEVDYSTNGCEPVLPSSQQPCVPAGGEGAATVLGPNESCAVAAQRFEP